jgi:hypothetical protein
MRKGRRIQLGKECNKINEEERESSPIMKIARF